MNRFTQLQGVRSNYEEQFYQPNFQLLQQALTKQQEGYDVAQDVTNKMPEHFKGDREAALAYREQMQQQMQNITNAYTTNGIQGGNMARRAAMLEVASAWQPGGKANNLEKNNKLIKDYEQRLQGQVDQGYITPDIKAALLENQTSNFKSYDGDNFTEFAGRDAAQHIQLQAQLTEYAKSFAAEAQTATGVKVGDRTIKKVMGGQYYEVKNGQVKYIDEGELKAFLQESYKGDKRMQSFIQQEDELFGTGQQQITSAIDAVSKAMSYEHIGYESQFIANRNFITPEMRARSTKDKPKVPGMQGRRVDALVSNGINLQPAPDGKDDVDNLINFNNNQADQRIAARAEALGRKYKIDPTVMKNDGSYLSKDSFFSVVGMITGDYNERKKKFAQEYDKIVQEELTISREKNKLIEGTDALNLNQTLEMYNSPEGRRHYPHMGMALDDTPRQQNQTDQEYREIIGKRAASIADVYNQEAVMTNQFSSESDRYKDVVKKYFTDGKIINTNFQALNGGFGVSDENPLQYHLNQAGYDIDISTPAGQAAFLKVADNFITYDGEMTAGQSFGEAGKVVPQGSVFELKMANGEGTISLIADNGNLENKAFAQAAQNFGLPMSTPNAQISTIKNTYTGEMDNQGYGGIIAQYLGNTNEEGELVPSYFVMKANVEYEGTQARNAPELYQVDMYENLVIDADGNPRKEVVTSFKDYVAEDVPGAMGITNKVYKPRPTTIASASDMIISLDNQLTKRSGYE